MTSHHGTHNDLHSEQGALPGEHPGRAKNPVIKVLDLAWLEFVKPDLAASERFAHAFGFTTVSRTADELQLRGTDAGAPCVIVRRGPARGTSVRPSGPRTPPTWCGSPTPPGRRSRSCRRASAGSRVDLTDPSGVAGPGRRRHPRARSPAGPADAGVQLRARRAARQRHAAPAA